MAPTTGLIDTSYHTAPTAHPMVIRPQERADRRDRQPGTSSGHHRRGRPKHHSQREPVSTRSKPSESLLEKEVLDTTTVKYAQSADRDPLFSSDNHCLCLSVHKIPRSVRVALNPSRLSRGRAISQRSRQTHGQSERVLAEAVKGRRVFSFFLCCFGHSRC